MRKPIYAFTPLLMGLYREMIVYFQSIVTDTMKIEICLIETRKMTLDKLRVSGEIVAKYHVSAKSNARPGKGRILYRATRHKGFYRTINVGYTLKGNSNSRRSV